MIGERLAMLRNEKKLTMRAIGELVGVSDAAWVKYEKNRAEPSIATLCKTAEIFNVSLDYLLGRTNIRDPKLIDTADIQNDFIKEFEESTIGDTNKFFNLFENLSGAIGLIKNKKVTETEFQLLLKMLSDLIVYFNDIHSMKEETPILNKHVFDYHTTTTSDMIHDLNRLLELTFITDDSEKCL
ncbi:helix-turn-helix domain-containing protein [Acetivibrio mesophilus]|uniref:XRE family transcriptional regulator n=1 Tax=Acetivibrio mesophilus TaxID=2487273 RepID=A0A4Q0I0W3_9FIRM|nr:helix-turn-helix transcriptional regulator [Acetivibrio mesophilus]RXE57733.1 XRE family transcriptional regulator [Acetivibrio mesophilus]